MADPERTASLMTPSKLADFKPRAVVSPAAWLSKMAADAGHQHVRRLRELSDDLRAQGANRDVSSLVSDLGRLAAALPGLDFGLLKSRGWWARITGKSRTAGAEFAALFAPIELIARGLAARTEALQKNQREQAAASDLGMLELEVEYRAVEKIIDQGARWLQDMRTQLKTRRAAPPDPAAQEQMKDDEARCEILVERLKALRAISSAAQQAHQHAKAAAGRRAALLQQLQQPLASGIKAWQERLSGLAAAAESNSPALSLEAPMEAHRDLQLCVKQTIADCGQLQGQEKTLMEALVALRTQVEGA